MRAYRVEGGTAHFGPGQVLGLSKEQLEPRRHLRHHFQKRDGMMVGSFEVAVEFKAGEVLHLPTAPSKGQAERLIPVDGEPDGRARPAPAAKTTAAKSTGKGKKKGKSAEPPAGDDGVAGAGGDDVAPPDGGTGQPLADPGTATV